MENKAKVISEKKKKHMNKDKLVKNDGKLILSDPRFAHIPSDPRYRNISTKQTKIRIDKRFKDVLMKDGFNVKPTLDPRGRPKSFNTKESFDKFYDLNSSEDETEGESEEDEEESDDSNDDKNLKKGEGKSDDTDSKEKEREFMKSLLDPERDLARGEAFYSDDSSDDDSSTTDEEEEQENEFSGFDWGELDADAQWDVDGNEVEETNRFAVCDMDWDNMKAVDLFVLFSSFVPTGGCIKKVTIYPSEFGKARLAEEAVSGPQELVQLSSTLKKNGKYNDNFSNLEKLKKGILDDSDSASPLELEALRRYQRNKLKYYYAVVECDSLGTAKAIYKECDRLYYEVNGVTLDLRYIPSDMEFDEVPHDICEKVPEFYEIQDPTISSLSLTKPTLTWDETDPRRTNVLKNTISNVLKKKDFNDEILKDFVASSDEEVFEQESENRDVSDDCDADDNYMTNGEVKKKRKNKIAKFRALISEIDEKEKKKQESTFTFEEETAFSAGHERDSEEDDENSQIDDGDLEIENEKSREKLDEDEYKNLTPFEKMLMKRDKKKKEIKLLKKQKKKRLETQGEDADKNKNTENDVQEKSYNELALLLMDEEQEDRKHFDMKKIQEEKEKITKTKKRKKNNVDDENSEIKSDVDFKIDTADSRFADLFTSSEFSLDPSHPKFDKHSLASQDIMSKQKKIKLNTELVVNSNNSRSNKNNDQHYSKLDSDISAMIKKLRTKTSKS